jgi:hypothetical protein
MILKYFLKINILRVSILKVSIPILLSNVMYVELMRTSTCKKNHLITNQLHITRQLIIVRHHHPRHDAYLYCTVLHPGTTCLGSLKRAQSKEQDIRYKTNKQKMKPKKSTNIRNDHPPAAAAAIIPPISPKNTPRRT